MATIGVVLGSEASGFTRRILTLDKHRVIGFQDGVTLLAQSFGLLNRLDLVLVDLELPDAGTPLVRQLRDRGFAGAIVVSAPWLSESLAVELSEVGADDFLKKPFTAATLTFTVMRALALVDARRGRG